VRRRRRSGEGNAQPQPAALQLVETQPDLGANVAMAEEEEESRRPVRRRRRSSAPLETGPLQMVETAPGAESRGESAPPAP
jgi:hypothetical protein